MSFLRLFPFAVLLVTGVLSADLPECQQGLAGPGAWDPPFDGPNDVIFNLYTQANPETPQIIEKDDDSSAPIFNPSNPTRFLIHGRNSGPQHMDVARQAYLATGNEYNVVMVDWSAPAKAGQDIMANVSVMVGDYIGQVINHLIEFRGLDPDDLHLTAGSMGCHVAGIAGKRVGGKISEIIALDPANHAYEGAPYEEQLAKSDAKFVQVLHTNTDCHGLLENQGHADFFPNGGAVQAGCAVEIIDLCSHSRGLDYFVESIKSNNFIATQCSSYEEYKAGACSANEHVVMGEYTPVTLSGTYYLDTNEQSPYAQGQTDL